MANSPVLRGIGNNLDRTRGVRRTRRLSAPSEASESGTRGFSTVLVVIVGALALLGAAPLGTSTAGHAPPVGSSASHGPASQLAEAQASMATGHGPRSPGMSHPALAGPAGPNFTIGIDMVWDAADGYVVAVSLNDSMGLMNNTYGPTMLTWIFWDGNWSLAQTNGSVPATLDPGLVYDAADGYVFLYGGWLMDAGYLPAPMTNQTWSYRAGNWTNLSAPHTPYSIDFANPVYDAADGYVLLYDEIGVTPTDPMGVYQRTWAYSGGNWTNLTSTAGTPPDYFGSMIYDPADGYVLYCGGYTLTDHLTNATWTFRNGSWANISGWVNGTPSGRIYSGIAYNSSSGQVLLYGGLDDTSPGNFSRDMWAYASGNWTHLSSNGPYYDTESLFANTQTMVYDPSTNGTVFLGAANASAVYNSPVTWEYADGNWSVAAPAFNDALMLADVGHPFTLSVTTPLHGGSLSYEFTGLPTGCSSLDAPSITCNATSAGSFPVSVTVTGSGGFRARAHTIVEVSSSPNLLAVNASRPMAEVGVSVGIDVTATPGTGTLVYSYAGLPAGCLSEDSAHLLCVPNAAGSYEITAQVTDAVGAIAFAILHLEVAGALTTRSFEVSSSAIDVGQSMELAASVTGGVGPIVFVYQGLPAACAATTTSALSCAPDSIGTFEPTFRATDTLGAVTQGTVRFEVHALPTIVSVEASSASIPAGGVVHLTTTIAGGTGPWSYRYSGLPARCTAADAPTIVCPAVPAGRYAIVVTVIDATGASATHGVAFTAVAPFAHPIARPGGGPAAPRDVGEAGGLFWLGLAVGGLAVLAVAILGGQKLRLARQGERIVRGLRDGRAAPGSSVSESGGPEDGLGAPRSRGPRL